MTLAFKHIADVNETRLESLGPKTSFYLWEQKGNEWIERCWSFEMLAQVVGETVRGFVVQTQQGPVLSIVEQKSTVFDDLDKASHFINDQVGQRMSWGYRTVRLPQPK